MKAISFSLRTLAAGLVCSSVALASAASTRPVNVIVLLADDMGWGDLGCQGHPVIRTPGIDSLAATGCRFEQFYVTAPVCSPSRAGLLTGRMQSRYGMQHIIRDHGPNPPVYHHVPVEEPTLPRLFQSAGFTTAHIGKWHLSFIGRKGEPTMADYGYDYSMELDAFKRYAEYYDSPWWRNGKPEVTTGQWTDTVYVDEAIKFIERSHGQPFFINLWSYAPHMEVEASRQFRAMYADRPQNEQIYFGTISQMDAEYKRLLDYLDRTGLAESTIVVFSSDNGPPPPLAEITNRALGSTGGLRGSKYCLYEGGIREPGIIRWPGVTRPGSVSREVCWTPDLMATFAAVYGLKLPENVPFDGIDLRPALRGEKLVRPKPLYWQYPFGNNVRGGVDAGSPGLAMRDGQWKLHCDPRFGHVELYNLDLDRNEQWNLKDVQPEVTTRLLKKLRAIHDEVNGPYSKEAHFLNPDMPVGSSDVKVE